MSEIMVSICCLVYNHEKYIRQCLDGFINQKCNFKYEVLIHDDASTDGSAEIIREYEKKYPEIIKPIYQTENQYSKGVRISLTLQYPRAKGKYIALCEGDDYWTDNNKLQKQYDIMQEHPCCGICVHTVNAVTEDNILKERIYPDIKWIKPGIINGDKLVRIACLGRYQFQTSSYFIRKDIIDKYLKSVPKFAMVAATGDTPLLLFIGNCSNCYYLQNAMSCYRHGAETSKSRTATKELYDRHYSRQIEMVKEYDIYTNGKYHKWCQEKIEAYSFSTAWEYKQYKEIAKLRYIKYMKRNKFGAKGMLKVFLLAYCPNLFVR